MTDLQKIQRVGRVVRHPRYLQIIVAVLGWALLANYLAGYLAVLAIVAAIAIVVPLEERELVERFGASTRPIASACRHCGRGGGRTPRI